MARLNKNLHEAKKGKKDEFYTQLSDIENEMKHYKSHFVGKVVYCNCDDARESNFFRFFQKKFKDYGLKKLITTSYNENGHGSVLIYEGDANNNGKLDDEEVKVKELQGNGDFRSEECIELLKESDIVVTNPPFSLFRDYVATLVQFDKKFLIIGNQNAITFKEVFPLIKENKLWLGLSMNGSNRWFRVPDDYEFKENASNTKIDERGYKYIFVNGVVWFTNLEHQKRQEKIISWKKYTAEDFPKYDNYDAIEVSKVTDIPYDYDGVMGVPITFLHKYNPTQFEIISIMSGAKGNCFVNGDDHRAKFYISNKGVYSRILIRRK